MFAQLVLGSALVCLTIFITVGFIAIASATLTRNGQWLISGNPFVRLMVSLSGIVLWLLAALSISVWVWAGAFLVLGQFETLEEAVYFSVVSFTTLGFGDVVIGKDWRLLSGIIAANGLILFSLVTAYLIEFIVRLRGARAE
ncbi:hypothetical protein EH31_10355 [Erythrobacter longus]|uniref:Potassium channel domain-containing protein n=1 Tax=Erythrobacter longus TaxID=1044 RepID=A0A074MCI6_ERYLO|nr:potassium channel family protein [Erythrobacter longus]KEO90480.1 hypothetical protein EH31_10355 [Erythrobacter longus]